MYNWFQRDRNQAISGVYEVIALSEKFSDRLITDREASTICGATTHMLRLARARGWIWQGVSGPKFHKVGRAVRYRLSEIYAWMEQLDSFSSNAEHHVAQQQERI